MSSHLTVAQTRELLESLKSVVRDFAAAEEKLNKDFRVKINATEKQFKDESEAHETKLATDLSAAEAEAIWNPHAKAAAKRAGRRRLYPHVARYREDYSGQCRRGQHYACFRPNALMTRKASGNTKARRACSTPSATARTRSRRTTPRSAHSTSNSPTLARSSSHWSSRRTARFAATENSVRG